MGGIDELLGPLNNVIEKETELLAFTNKEGFKGLEIKNENFHELGLFSSDKDLIAIDGGNAEIINSSSLSLQFIRVVGVRYKENKRKEVIKKEFFCIITANVDNGLKYIVNIYGDSFLGKKIEFDSKNVSPDGEKRILEIEQVGDIIRRIAELKLANEIKSRESYLVIDGSIEVKTKEELEIIKEIIKTDVAFLSKTSRMLTKNGNSLNAALNDLGPKSSWFYYPVFEIINPNYLGEMYFIKLNSKSNYVFKLEINGNADGIILSLARNSNDPVFFGYPYCLIEADKLARVSNKEREYLKTIILSKVKNKDRLKYLFSSMDAHSILDKIG